MTTTVDNLERLEYSHFWLDIGILTENELADQIREYNKSEDRNTEHYRYKSFKKFLDLKPKFDDISLNKLFHIIKHDKNRSMANSMALDILKQKYLSADNFTVVSEFLIQTFGNDMQKYVDRELIYRQPTN